VIRTKTNANKNLQNARIIRYDVTDSTNTRAREYAKENAPDSPVVFIAEAQSAGRGRRGRSFDSSAGSGIYISFLMPVGDRQKDAASITANAAVKLCRALEEVFGISAGIKWVNDIYVNDRKLAGILAESVLSDSGEIKYYICGIGINIFKRIFPDEIKEIAITVEEIIAKKPAKYGFLDALLAEFLSDEDEDFIVEYRKRSILIGEEISVYLFSGDSFSATVLDVGDGAELIVKTEDGKIKSLTSAEVSVRKK
jgi:BirA family biotin operon repressor/biotin-[acetyl-CoA-carboxylase] ligase